MAPGLPRSYDCSCRAFAQVSQVDKMIKLFFCMSFVSYELKCMAATFILHIPGSKDFNIQFIPYIRDILETDTERCSTLMIYVDALQGPKKQDILQINTKNGNLIEDSPYLHDCCKNTKLWILKHHNIRFGNHIDVSPYYMFAVKMQHMIYKMISKPFGYGHRETSRDALLEFIVSTENLSVCLHL